MESWDGSMTWNDAGRFLGHFSLPRFGDIFCNALSFVVALPFFDVFECFRSFCSGTVDKRHAVITFDLYLNRFKVKDLSTCNGTYVNESRIPEQEYVTLNHMDSIRLGYDVKVYHMEQGEPTNDSPPPPPLPLQPPPTTLSKNTLDIDDDVPSWVPRHSIPHMAECQGCIAEQRIEHTCNSHLQHSHSQHQFVEKQLAQRRTDVPEEDASEPEPDQTTPRLGRNTWPRKKVRQQHPHVAVVFDGDDDGGERNQIPVESGNNYFVSVDDNVINTGRQMDYLSDTVSSGVQRITRNSKMPLPPELETVKRGTPLYGQPAWWGEEGADTPRNPGENLSQSPFNQKSSRPSSLIMNSEDSHLHHKQGAVCMEIPHGSTPPGHDQPLHDKTTPARDKTTPARSITSSISKDSLLLTPQTPDCIRDKQFDHSEVGSKAIPSNLAAGTMDNVTNPSLSFTVEFGDVKKPKLNMSGSLSEFVPPKVRKSLASHSRSEKPASGGRASSSSSKNSEERELSPGVQKRVDEVTGSEASRGKTGRHSSGQGTGVPSLITADFSSESAAVDKNRDATKKKSGDFEKKDLKLQEDKKSAPRTPSSKSSKSKPFSSLSSIHSAHYADPTAYLIDKMFAGTTGGGESPYSSLTSEEHESSDSPDSPEYALYREAAKHDHAGHVGDKNHEKPPAHHHKQKSSSRSPPDRPTLKSKKSPEQLQPNLQLPNVPAAGDNEDKASEAGTYTIEVDQDDQEELEARHQIDELFGVDVENFPLERPVIGSVEKLPSLDDEDRTLNEDDGGSRTPCDEMDGLEVFDNHEEESPSKMSSNGEGVPAWVSQLSALTAGGHKASLSKSLDSGHIDMSKKPPHGGGGSLRKRPGTGRKLPSIPAFTDSSPISNEPSLWIGDNGSSEITTGGGTVGRAENGHNHHRGNGPFSKTKSCSPDPALSSESSKRRHGNVLSSRSSKSSSRDGGGITNGSHRSRGSIDTEILLRDTESVMVAMEARMGFHSLGSGGSYDDDAISDPDLSSTVATVNGDEDYIKPTKYHSPRQALTCKSTKENSNIKIAHKNSNVQSRSEQKISHTHRSGKSVTSITDTSLASDVCSGSDILDDSIQLDTGLEQGLRITRSNSLGKGTISMAKPNRAFALRRARADGSDSQDSPRSSRTGASTSTYRRSSSVHSTSRTTDKQQSGRSEATSLGGKIVRKARENASSQDTPVTRMEIRRHSLKTIRTTTPSSTTSSTSSSIAAAKKDHDLKKLKNQLKAAPPNKDLAITGIASRSQSQPGSRSGSPKAAERMAWKRRKEYDPRKAVADAKAKAKTGPSNPPSRPKPKMQSNLNQQRMIRSASFTNSIDMKVRTRHDTFSVNSTNSIDDLSSAATATENYGETSFRRAFIPFHNPLRSDQDRLSHSADEDEHSPFPVAQEVGASKLVTHSMTLLLPKSAFTPPLSKLTPSPDSPPPSATSILLRRRTLGAVECEEVGGSTSGASSHRMLAGSPQSYDTLIVSSIYQLSLKLKTATDRTLGKLREQDRVSITPSPIDDFLGHTAKSEIPAWKSANQELAGVLKNLRKIEHHLHVMEGALFPDEDTDTDVSGMSNREKQKYFQEIERIRSELAGFQPIDTPSSDTRDPESPEMAELAEEFC